MPTMPAELAFIILAFRPLFSQRVWACAQTLLIGAILAPGKRTVTSALQVMGLSDEHHFQNYHRALNRAVWNCRHAGLILRMLLTTFVPSGPLVLGLDDTSSDAGEPGFAPAASIVTRSDLPILISSRLVVYVG